MQDLQCLLATSELEVYHDAAREWLYTRWLGRHTETSIQQAIESICTCLRGRTYTKILSDHSCFVGEWPATAPWAMESYFNYLAAQGVAHFAWVYNEGRHNLVTMQQMLACVTRPAVAIFQDVASAYDWLRRCPVAVV